MRTGTKSQIVFFIIFFTVSSYSYASVEADVNEGNKLLKLGQADSAMEHYRKAFEKKPESDVINFNIGTAYYKNGDFDSAIKHLNKGLLTEDASLRQKVYYNLGNAYYMSAKDMQADKGDMNRAVSVLEQSLKHFQSAIDLDQKDTDAKINYDIVKRELERLKQELKDKQENKKEQRQQADESANKDDQSHEQGQDKQQNSQNNQQGESRQDSDSQNQRNEDKNQNSENGSFGDNKKDESAGSGREENRGESSRQQSSAENEQNKNTTMSEAPKDSLTRKEAEMILNNYLQTEEPQRLLNLEKGNNRQDAVLKDW